MLIYWQVAERCLRKGEDPGPALAEALKNGEQPLFLRRDYLGQILNAKARAEAARGTDPTATLDRLLVNFQPLLLQGRPSWTLCENAAEAWLIRADWEASHGQNPNASLSQGEALSHEALQANPGSARAQALNALAQARLLKPTHRRPGSKPQ